MPDYVLPAVSRPGQRLHCILLLALFVAGAPITPVSAEVYKWKDEHGRTHYGDRPGNDQARQIEIESLPDNSNTIPEDRKIKQQRLLQLFAEEREAKRRQKIDEENKKIARSNACAKARNHRDEILAAGYLYEEDDDGNKRILSSSEFEAHLSKTEDMIEKLCS
jgi:hypothetical protein